MRRDVHWTTVCERQRTVAVEKTPRPDHAPLPQRQRAPDFQRAKVGAMAGIGFDHGQIVLVIIALFLAAALSGVAPDFKLADQDGKAVTLSAARGAKVVLVFYRGYW